MYKYDIKQTQVNVVVRIKLCKLNFKKIKIILGFEPTPYEFSFTHLCVFFVELDGLHIYVW